MLNSRDIDDLRADVAANCRVWMQLCRDAGLAVTKKRTRVDGICWRVNIPWGTILPVEGDFITYKAQAIGEVKP